MLEKARPQNVCGRAQGLDGEATEPFVRELAVEVEEKLDPEVEFAVASELVEEDSLPLLVSQLAVDSVSYDAHEYNSILRLLDQAVNVQVRRCRGSGFDCSNNPRDILLFFLSPFFPFNLFLNFVQCLSRGCTEAVPTCAACNKAVLKGVAV